MSGGEVVTEVPSGEGGFRDFLRWRRQRKGIIQAHQARGEKLPSVHPNGAPVFSDGNDAIVWIGHATTLTRLNGRTFLNDPIWSRKAAHVIARMTPPGLEWASTPRPDFVLVSHNHYDHMDAPSLKRMRDVVHLVPKGDKRWFERRRFRSVHEFNWWQTRDIDGIQATYVPSKHFSGRTPWDRNRSLYGGWVVKSGPRAIYHSGDSGYFSGFAEIGDRFPGIDVACLPIGAYEPRWFMQPFHTNPEEAGQAFLDVRARRLMPIHWGTFRLSDEAMDEPPARIRTFFEANGLPQERLLLGDLGQPHSIRAPD